MGEVSLQFNPDVMGNFLSGIAIILACALGGWQIWLAAERSNSIKAIMIISVMAVSLIVLIALIMSTRLVKPERAKTIEIDRGTFILLPKQWRLSREKKKYPSMSEVLHNKNHKMIFTIESRNKSLVKRCHISMSELKQYYSKIQSAIDHYYSRIQDNLTLFNINENYNLPKEYYINDGGLDSSPKDYYHDHDSLVLNNRLGANDGNIELQNRIEKDFKEIREYNNYLENNKIMIEIHDKEAERYYREFSHKFKKKRVKDDAEAKRLEWENIIRKLNRLESKLGLRHKYEFELNYSNQEITDIGKPSKINHRKIVEAAIKRKERNINFAKNNRNHIEKYYNNFFNFIELRDSEYEYQRKILEDEIEMTIKKLVAQKTNNEHKISSEEINRLRKYRSSTYLAVNESFLTEEEDGQLSYREDMIIYPKENLVSPHTEIHTAYYLSGDCDYRDKDFLKISIQNILDSFVKHK